MLDTGICGKYRVTTCDQYAPGSDVSEVLTSVATEHKFVQAAALLGVVSVMTVVTKFVSQRTAGCCLTACNDRQVPKC